MIDRTTDVTSYGLQGGKLYQQRARQALPLLVRQVRAEQPISYTDLAEELDMPNPRNLNYVLGAIRDAMQALSDSWRDEIPPIHALVYNKSTGLPGKGIFASSAEALQFRSASIKRRHEIVHRMLEEVYVFQRWDTVLQHFGIPPAEADTAILSAVSLLRRSTGGESPEHEELKKRVALHPEWFGLQREAGPGDMEFVFGSADRVDVLFKSEKGWMGVEVKSARSTEDDLARGLFQCVKYCALIEATDALMFVKQVMGR
ncbi:hypothetical protein [Candidatus Palauibacter sp.]|uniref:hypothetical protein n=1 Tax=Candidatus Palauibacter sp. TaxID=3101350 RepID=UPI003C70039E